VSRIAVLDSGVTFDEDGVRYPTVVIDVSNRPDVADLARVHAIEGVGDITTLLTIDGDTAVLTVQLTRPVSTEFSIAFPLPESRAVLDDAATTGNLLLATTPPGDGTDRHPLWLAIDLDGERLAALLDGLGKP
jgi:hypothetical protein